MEIILKADPAESMDVLRQLTYLYKRLRHDYDDLKKEWVSLKACIEVPPEDAVLSSIEEKMRQLADLLETLDSMMSDMTDELKESVQAYYSAESKCDELASSAMSSVLISDDTDKEQDTNSHSSEQALDQPGDLEKPIEEDIHIKPAASGSVSISHKENDNGACKSGSGKPDTSAYGGGFSINQGYSSPGSGKPDASAYGGGFSINQGYSSPKKQRKVQNQINYESIGPQSCQHGQTPVGFGSSGGADESFQGFGADFQTYSATKKKGLFSKLASFLNPILHGNKEKTEMKSIGVYSSAPNPFQTVNVQQSKPLIQFSAIAPKSLENGEYSIIQVLVYEDGFRSVVDGIISQQDNEVNETPGGVLQIRPHSKIKICLSSPDLEKQHFIPSAITQIWEGGYLNFSFGILLPGSYSKRHVLFVADVYVNDLIASKLSFIAAISGDREQHIDVQRHDILSAFISYASEDRSRVATIIQGMQKARPEMDIFLDVERLRSGTDWEPVLYKEIDERDVFFLCWSLYARNSKWVEKEWRYALLAKGLELIDPIPLDPPDICPPPAELNQKHFNDPMLFIAR